MNIFLSFLLLCIGTVIGLAFTKNTVLPTLISKILHYIIYILLFFLGVSLGGSEDFYVNIKILGEYALLISIASIVGSLLASKIVYVLFFAKKI